MKCQLCKKDMELISEGIARRDYKCSCGWEDVQCFEPNTPGALTSSEIRWIRELVEDRMHELKTDCPDMAAYDIEIFESILNKLK